MASRKKEVLHLYEWCRVVLEALVQLDPGMAKYRDDWMQSLDGALQLGRVSPFREAANDLLEWVHGLNPGARARVDQALRSKFGTGLAEDTLALADDVKAILERRIVKNEDEFRVLQSWAEIIADDPNKRSEKDAISKLMERFLTGRE
jgi:hypothetical protein